MNRLHKMPCDIARLTDRQLYELVYHPRNKDGQIEIVSVEIPTPEQLEEADPPTPEDQQDALCRLKMMLGNMIDTTAAETALKEKLRAREEGGGDGAG